MSPRAVIVAADRSPIGFGPGNVGVSDATLTLGSPAPVKRELTEAEPAGQANGTRICHELAGRSRTGPREVTPLSALEPDRPAATLAGGAAVPLFECRNAVPGRPGERSDRHT